MGNFPIKKVKGLHEEDFPGFRDKGTPLGWNFPICVFRNERVMVSA